MKNIQTLSLFILFVIVTLNSQAQILAEIDGDIQSIDETPTLYLYDDGSGENRIEGELGEVGDNIRLVARYGNLELRTGASGTATTRMDIASTGQIGIGTISNIGSKVRIQSAGNERALHLVGNSGGTNDLAIRMSNSGGDHYIFDDADDGHSLEFESANAFKINTGGPSQRMEVDENGMIGVNINGSAFARLRIASGSESYATYSQAYGTGINKFGVYGQAVNRDNTNNFYGIYGVASTTGTNSWAGFFSGDVGYTGALTFVSDRKLKENIENLNSVLSRVMQLKPVTYQMKKETYPGLNLADGPQIGFISQDVEQIFPDFVEDQPHLLQQNSEDPNAVSNKINIKCMNYMSFIPVLTKAIQEQQEIISQLKSQLEAQQITIDKLNK